MKVVARPSQSGFTLVELLIVVIILALLAAIVVPQFASSTDDAKVASLDSTLSNVRSAIDLYYQQHGEYPAAKAATTSACTNGTAGTGAANSSDAFLDQLAYYTNADGEACTQQNGTAFPYGPYLKKRELPNNPITSDATLRVVNTGDLNLAGSNPAAGWAFDDVSGKFIADDSVNTDANGNTFDTH